MSVLLVAGSCQIFSFQTPGAMKEYPYINYKITNDLDSSLTLLFVFKNRGWMNETFQMNGETLVWMNGLP